MARKVDARPQQDVRQYQGVWYNAERMNNSTAIVTLLVTSSDPNPANRMRRFVKEHKQTLRGVNVIAQKGRYLKFTMADAWNRLHESRVHDAIAFVVENLPQTGYVPARYCASCGLDTPHAAIVRDELMPLCDNCAAAQTRVQASKPVYHGSFMLGLVGALLGAIVGAVPWMLVYYFSDIMSGWLSFLIAVGAFTGYKLLNGTKKGALVRLAVYPSTVFASFFSFIILLAFAAYEEFGVFSLEWAWTIFTDPDFLSEMVGELVFSGLMGIVGLVVIEAMLKKFLYASDVPVRFLDPRVSQAEPAAVAVGPLSAGQDDTASEWQQPPVNGSDSADERPDAEA